MLRVTILLGFMSFEVLFHHDLCGASAPTNLAPILARFERLVAQDVLQAGLTILVRRVTLGTLEVAPLVGQEKIRRRGFPQFVEVFRVGLEFFVGGEVLKSFSFFRNLRYL